MPSRKRSFQETVSQLEKTFRLAFPGKPTLEQQPLVDRIRRSLSWLQRACTVSEDDRPPRFVDLWIGLNALYGLQHYEDGDRPHEKSDFMVLIDTLMGLPSGKKELVRLVEKNYIQERVQALIMNPYLWKECWRKDIEHYEKRSHDRIKSFARALRDNDVKAFWENCFERLNLLRNQIFHGSASADTRRNRDTLFPAILLLEEVIPIFIRLMIDEGPLTDWSPIPFPGRGSPHHPVSKVFPP